MERLNHVTSEKVMESPEVVLGKLDVEGALAIVLLTRVLPTHTSLQSLCHNDFFPLNDEADH